VLLTISFFVFINSTQGFVLKEILKVPVDSLGEYSGNLVFYDELLSIIAVVVWGILSDRIGKYFVFGSGLTFISASLFAYTFAINLYPQMLSLRLLFAVGGAACSAMMTAVLADIVIERDKGKFAGLVGLTSGLGALLGVFVFLRLPPTLGLQYSYFVVAGIALVSASLFLVVPLTAKISSGEELESGNDEEAEGGFVATQNKANPFQSAKAGILAAKNPNILLGYISSFLARGDSVSITLFIPLWVYKYYLEQGLCDSTNSLAVNELVQSCRPAYLRASVMSGVAQVFALFGAPLFGYLSDRMYRPATVLIASIFAGVGYFLLAFSGNPSNAINFVYLSFIGIGEIGLIVTSLGLVTHSSIPKDSRGSVAGIASFFGAFGILLCTRLGGYLFDNWWTGGPFFLLGIIHTIFLMLGIVVIAIEMKTHGGLNLESYRNMRDEFHHHLE
jgi:MFS family permease